MTTTDLQLVNKNEVPANGFRYHQAETDFTIRAPSWIDLVREVKKHRVANNLPIGLGFEREIEQQLAGNLPPNFVEAYQPPVKYPLPREEWPSWAKAFALLKTSADVGVGDTIERLIGVHNSARFKEWYQEKFKRDCGCQYRKEQWNLMYGYVAPQQVVSSG